MRRIGLMVQCPMRRIRLNRVPFFLSYSWLVSIGGLGGMLEASTLPGSGLALMTDRNQNIVPFGKYKGQPLEALVADQVPVI